MLDWLRRQRISIGETALVGSLLVIIGLWLALPPQVSGGDGLRRVAGELSATLAVATLAWVLALACRFGSLERVFGGLDRSYRTHRAAGVLAVALLLVHVFLMPWAINSGTPAAFMAITGFLVLTVISIAPRIPVLRAVVRIGYRGWKVTHRFIGLFLIMGLAHALLAGSAVRSSPPAFGVMLGCFIVGVVLYLYLELVVPIVRRRYRYVVESIEPLARGVLEIRLSPVRRRLHFIAGQFTFVKFAARGCGSGIRSRSRVRHTPTPWYLRSRKAETSRASSGCACCPA